MRNQHFKKSCGGGERETRRRGRYLVLLLVFLTWIESGAALAAPGRELWLYDAIMLPFLPTQSQSLGHQAYLGTTNHRESFLFAAGARANLHWFEFGVLGSRTNDAIPRNSFAVDVSRSFVSQDLYFGRLSLGYLHFSPAIQRHAKIVVQTGILPTLELPWGLRLQSSLCFRIPKGGAVIGVTAESYRHLGTESSFQFDLGGALDWNTVNGDSDGPGQYDYMLFSMGPWARMSTLVGDLRLGAWWRLWLDREYSGTPGALVQTNVSEFRALPDLSVSWTLAL